MSNKSVRKRQTNKSGNKKLVIVLLAVSVTFVLALAVLFSSGILRGLSKNAFAGKAGAYDADARVDEIMKELAEIEDENGDGEPDWLGDPEVAEIEAELNDLQQEFEQEMEDAGSVNPDTGTGQGDSDGNGVPDFLE